MSGVIQTPAPQTTPEPHKELLNEDTEQDIGILQQIVPVIAQQLIALILVVSFVYVVAYKYEAPMEGFSAIVSMVVGFYFGSKTISK